MDLSGASLILEDRPGLGFENGTLSPFATRTAQGVTLRAAEGATEFEGSNLSAGTFDGTALVGGRVELSGAAGSYTTPPIAFDGASYGRLIADVLYGAGGNITFDVVSPAGAVLQASLLPGAYISVNGTADPTVRLRATIAREAPGRPPALLRLGAGHALTDYMGPLDASRSLAGTQIFGHSLELRESWLNFTENASNPIAAGAAGTYFEQGMRVSSAVGVGAEIWVYFAADDGVGDAHFGRMVSVDGGLGWSVDPQPVLNNSASGWDGYAINTPYVLPLEAGGFGMWYMAGGPNNWKVGYATSPDGITWTRYASNPVLTPTPGAWDSDEVGWPHVLKVGATFHLYYTGKEPSTASHSIGHATSSDGIAWTKDPENPIIAYGSTPEGALDVYDGGASYRDGRFVLYWTCGPSVDTADSCIATSTNGSAFIQQAGNPFITQGDGTWDEGTAEQPFQAFDPVSGHMFLLFFGRPHYAGTYSVGRADPLRESPGTYELVWNLAPELPAAMTAFHATASLPPSTTVNATVGTGPDSGEPTASASVALDEPALVLAPGAVLRETLRLSTANRSATPSVTSTRVDYRVFAGAGSFDSQPFPQSAPIRSAALVVHGDLPTATRVSAWVSTDGGSSWSAADGGTAVAFTGPGTDFRYRLALNGTSNARPLVTSVEAVLAFESFPSNVTLQGPAGEPLAFVPGTLNATQHVAINRSWFNDQLSPVLNLSAPPMVEFGLWVTAATPGVVVASRLNITLSSTKWLEVEFLPVDDPVRLEPDSSVTLQALVNASVDLPVTITWWRDGVQLPSTGSQLDLTGALLSPGHHTANCTVSGGNLSFSHAWNITVAGKPTAAPQDAGMFPYVLLILAAAAAAAFIALRRLRHPPPT